MAAETPGPVTTVSIITRRLKAGKTYEDFRRAWFHTTGFGVGDSGGKVGSNRMFTLINMSDPREVIVIGFATATPGRVEEALKIEVKFRGDNPLDEVIEPGIGRTFGLLVAEDDFSAAGDIPYTPPMIAGTETDMVAFETNLKIIAGLFAAAAERRDAINDERKKRT